ncbi:Gfo/Idh/MocA family oxidoreductase [Formicincola oecophyllae]|uniref:Gfo/Idh/MocA family oxidoreductase n=1 Tax=Formicincola oecophyllae TaxID=2558361 RepID=A0A4Y6UCL2_9PROT|nr:Gfo/Idh/MocA family oxidoreductase [Formicincola oecophyllae]QDH14216.1 Gfo/Idh/MocA family oxidoreductase [Formicincola oecophyllae]
MPTTSPSHPHPTQRLAVGVVGAGRFGALHAQKAALGARMDLVGVHDLDKERGQVVARAANCAFWPDFSAMLGACDAVVVATPAGTHAALTSAALQAGCHVLVEKPIATTLGDARTLGALAQRQGKVLQVGHLLRYSAEHALVTARMKRPLYVEATRLAPFSLRGTDTSVVLDLMIHDLDFILSVMGGEVAGVEAMGAAVSSTSADIANARVRFSNGAVATLTASRISLKTERKMRFFGAEGYLSVDFGQRKAAFINRHEGLVLPGTVPMGTDGQRGSNFRRAAMAWKNRDLIALEQAAFAASCLDGAPVMVDAAAATRALEAALRVNAAMAANRATLESAGLLP